MGQFVPCQHIADYYQREWEARHCIAYNILRHGYRQWADGTADHPANNLFEAAPWQRDEQ